jgi:hypothetical protein
MTTTQIVLTAISIGVFGIFITWLVCVEIDRAARRISEAILRAGRSAPNPRFYRADESAVTTPVRVTREKHRRAGETDRFPRH